MKTARLFFGLVVLVFAIWNIREFALGKAHLPRGWKVYYRNDDISMFWFATIANWAFNAFLLWVTLYINY